MKSDNSPSKANSIKPNLSFALRSNTSESTRSTIKAVWSPTGQTDFGASLQEVKTEHSRCGEDDQFPQHFVSTYTTYITYVTYVTYITYVTYVTYINYTTYILVSLASLKCDQFGSSAKMKTIGGKNGGKSYTLGEELGKGTFGNVYSSPPYAIKHMNLDRTPNMKAMFANEISIMQKLNHPNIVTLFDVIYQGHNIYLIMERCDMDLKEYIAKKDIEEKSAVGILKQILSGFYKLVEKGIIHRDLKPANILVNSKGQFKLADFGLARVVDQYDKKLLETLVGTPLYMAPQILKKANYTTKCDVWSLGVIFYEMLTGKLPWTAKSERELLNNILKKPLSVPANISPWTKQLLSRMLTVDEHDRIGWDDLFKYITKKEDPQPDKPATLESCESNKLMKLFEIELREAVGGERAAAITAGKGGKLAEMQNTKIRVVLEGYLQDCQSFLKRSLGLAG